MKISAAEFKGRREYMEDTILIKTIQNDIKVLSVFDGHAGDSVSLMCKNRFTDIFEYNMFIRNMNNALKNTYKTLNTFAEESPFTGATAASVVIKDNHFWVANCGDTEVVGILKSNTAIVLSERHKVIDELDRLQGICKVTKSNKFDTFRINNTLNIARAIGDAYQPSVISVPAVSDHSLSNFKFIVIASDGLWDVLSPFDVKNIILNNQDSNPEVILKTLIQTAYDNASSDNISIILVNL